MDSGTVSTLLIIDINKEDLFTRKHGKSWHKFGSPQSAQLHILVIS